MFEPHRKKDNYQLLRSMGEKLKKKKGGRGVTLRSSERLQEEDALRHP